MTKNVRKPRPFRERDIDWRALAEIGIERDDLLVEGHLDTLLQGGRTEPIPVTLSVNGAEITCDATLALLVGDQGPVLEIRGVEPAADDI